MGVVVVWGWVGGGYVPGVTQRGGWPAASGRGGCQRIQQALCPLRRRRRWAGPRQTDAALATRHPSNTLHQRHPGPPMNSFFITALMVASERFSSSQLSARLPSMMRARQSCILRGVGAGVCVRRKGGQEEQGVGAQPCVPSPWKGGPQSSAHGPQERAQGGGRRSCPAACSVRAAIWGPRRGAGRGSRGEGPQRASALAGLSR